MNFKKIAIIYTGEVRTIEKTIKYFKQNVLLNENVHVFAVLQSNNIDYFEKIVKDQVENNLKSLIWLNKNDDTWVNIRENLLENIYLISHWKEYLRNSGSMIEYYQMYLAFNEITKFESEENFQYDYIMRIRCDVVLSHPIYFNFDNYTIESVKEFLNEIKNKKNLDTILSYEILSIFMNTFYYKNRLNCDDLSFDIYPSSESYYNIFNLNNEEEFIKNVYEYLMKGNYLITIRSNQIYFIKRCYFEPISILGITYGCAHIMNNNEYWFNAESQLKQICIKNKIDVFNSITILEEKSLYEYNELNYIENGQLKDTCDFLFFVMRN